MDFISQSSDLQKRPMNNLKKPGVGCLSESAMYKYLRVLKLEKETARLIGYEWKVTQKH